MLIYVTGCTLAVVNPRMRRGVTELKSEKINWRVKVFLFCACVQIYEFQYIPLISRVRGPYGKLWTEFFPSFYGPSAKRAGHENKEGKNEDP